MITDHKRTGGHWLPSFKPVFWEEIELWIVISGWPAECYQRKKPRLITDYMIVIVTTILMILMTIQNMILIYDHHDSGLSSHWGTFQCRAANGLGEDTAEITLSGQQSALASSASVWFGINFQRQDHINSSSIFKDLKIKVFYKKIWKFLLIMFWCLLNLHWEELVRLFLSDLTSNFPWSVSLYNSSIWRPTNQCLMKYFF